MAQLVIAAAGAAIGGYLVPGAIALGITGAQAGWVVGSLIGSSFAPAQKSQGPRLSDLSVGSSAYGTPIPFVQGSPRLAGQIVYASTKREIATTTRQGGKGGGAKQKVTTYSYEVDLLILLSDNIIPGITRIWSNGKLIWNKSLTADAATIAASDTTSAWTRLAVYTGAASQLPDPTYEAAVGTANAPAYRGRGSVFIQGLQLGSSGQIPNLTFEIGSTLSAVVPSAELTLGTGVGVQVVALDDSYAMVAYTAGGSGGYIHLLDISGAAPVSLYSANFLSPGDAIGTFTRIDSTRALIMLKLGIDARACMMVMGRVGSTVNWGSRVVAPVGVAVTAGGDQYANTSKLDATRFLTCYKNGNFLASYVTTVDASALTVTNVGANYNSGSYSPILYARGVATGGSSGVGIITKQPFDDEIDPVPLTITGDVVTYGTLGAYIDTKADGVILEPLTGGNAFCGYSLFSGTPGISHANAAVSNGSGGSFLRTADSPYMWNSAGFGSLGGFAALLDTGTSDLYAVTLSLSGGAVGARSLISASSTVVSDLAIAPGGAGVVAYVRSGASYVRKLVMA